MHRNHHRPEPVKRYYLQLSSGNADHCKGSSLIELMVASTIGLLIISTVVATFIWSHRNSLQDNGTARMQENARYALESITRDLQMSEFLLNTVDSKSIGVDLVTGSLNIDCGATGDEWAFDMASLISVLPQATPATIESNHNCIDRDDLHTVGASNFTDVLSIKRVYQPTTDLIKGQLYLQTTVAGDARLILHNNENNPDPEDGGYIALFEGATSMRYSPAIYYVNRQNDEKPVLIRKTLQGINDGTTNTLQMAEEGGGVAEGIEYFHIMWGVDEEMIDGIAATEPDGDANFFVSSPTPAQWLGIVAARIYVLVKNLTLDTTYRDNKQYQMGDVTLPTTGTYADNYKRKVFSSTVMLRNQEIRNTLATVFN